MSSGLYALKPRYADSLAGVRLTLIRGGVSPGTVTLAGVGFGVLAGATLATATSPVVAAPLVGALMAARLAAANLDGAIARDTGASSRWGAVVNELGDRGAELAVLAGCFALAPAWLVLAAMLGASAPSWVALAGAAATVQTRPFPDRACKRLYPAATDPGSACRFVLPRTPLSARVPETVRESGPRINGGPVGKTERCVLITVLAAVPAHASLVLGVIAVGSVLTAGLRLRALHHRFA